MGRRELERFWGESNEQKVLLFHWGFMRQHALRSDINCFAPSFENLFEAESREPRRARASSTLSLYDALA